MLSFLRQTHAALYRATRGLVGHRVPRHPPMLLLAHLGAKSGKRRISGLTYMPYDGSFVVVGSYGGGPRSPGWVYNLRAAPDVEVQVGREKIKVRAREAGEGERQRLWAQAARYHPAWGLFQQRTARAFPVVILTPRPENFPRHRRGSVNLTLLLLSLWLLASHAEAAVEGDVEGVQGGLPPVGPPLAAPRRSPAAG